MTTQIFSRKWRPSSFSDLIGQEHISATLKSAVRSNRIANSYLFTGPRGTGKTSSARIFAKLINCLDSIDGDPCNKCNTCVSINENRNMDIIELDAASNRGVEEIRNIVEKINFMPSQSRKKVYIIDEAHMLTNQASNAFLKTLEEPPNHVIFILCTTESQNLIPTLVSRCQRYDFRRITTNKIADQLQKIAIKENIIASNDALQLIAKNAVGSLRDAENLFEQISVSYNNDITVSNVEDILGIANEYTFIPLVNSLLTKNITDSLAILDNIIWDGIEARIIHKQTLDLLMYSIRLIWGADGAVDATEDVKSELSDILKNIEHSQLFHAINIWTSIDSRRVYLDSIALEIAVARICKEEPVQQEQVNTSNSNQPRRQPPPQRRNHAPPPQRRPSVRKDNIDSNKDNIDSNKDNIDSNKDNIDLIWKEITVLLAKENNDIFNIWALVHEYSSLKFSENKEHVLVSYESFGFCHQKYMEEIFQKNNINNILLKYLQDKLNTIKTLNIESNSTNINENYLINSILEYGFLNN